MSNGSFQPEQRERKFLVDASAAQSFWSLASSQLEPKHPDPMRPYLYVRTTYFDTVDFAYFHSERAAVARRLRVREYATAATPDERPIVDECCYLELKEHAGALRSKVRVPLSAAGVASHLPSLSGAPVVPCVTTCYRRKALADDGLGLRVTLDDRLEFRPPAPLGSPYPWSPEPRSAAPALMVLEVKLWHELPRWLAVALEGLPEAVGFSKFSTGMRAAHECGLIELTAPATEVGAL